MRFRLPAFAAAFVLAGAVACSGGSTDSPLCPGRPTAFGIEINIAAVPAGTTLRLCSDAGCSTERVTPRQHAHRFHATGKQSGFGYKLGTTNPVMVRVTLRAIRNGHVHISAATLTIPQDIVQGCGNYGGIGRAKVTANFRLVAEPGRPN
jgi:hypothetical protein